MQPIKDVSVLVDNESWILPYTDQLVEWVEKQGYIVNYCRSQSDLIESDVSFFLGCTQIVKTEQLALSRLNLVVHESALPKGKGFAPVAWQILEGKSIIPVCLIEANEKTDSGKIWLKDQIILKGDELCKEWRRLQGEATVRLCKKFLSDYDKLTPKDQQGHESFYPRRKPIDSQLEPQLTIAEQFNLLRVVDNERYPAFFIHNGRKYRITISDDYE